MLLMLLYESVLDFVFVWLVLFAEEVSIDIHVARVAIASLNVD